MFFFIFKLLILEQSCWQKKNCLHKSFNFFINNLQKKEKKFIIRPMHLEWRTKRDYEISVSEISVTIFLLLLHHELSESEIRKVCSQLLID